MKRRTRIWLISVGSALGAVVLFVAAQYLVRGTPPPADARPTPVIVAHRGVHANYQKGVYDPVSGCEAKHIFPLTHDIIENTIDSIGAAFDAGATIVEIDIRRSADDHLMIMHDYMLDCRTNGTGNVSDHDLAYLKSLDIGYGYTADGGQTYPLRGKGVGKMPTLEEVLSSYPDGSFLIDHKDGDERSTRILMQILQHLTPEQRARIWYWGPPEMLALVQSQYPEVRQLFLLRWQMKKYAIPFLLTFGLSGFPDEFEGVAAGLPVEYLRYVWGWPYRFINRLHAEGMPFFLYVDTAEDALALRNLPVDGFITDYIEETGPILSKD